MTTFGPTMSYGARATIFGPACSFGTTIGAMLWVFARRANFLAMYFFVAMNAKCLPIIYVEGKFWELRNRFNVMRMKTTGISAFLAGIIVSLKDFFSPLCQIAFELRAKSMACLSAFPCRSLFTNHRFSAARPGAKHGPLVSAVKFLSAIGAFSGYWWITNGPAFLAAILGVRSAIRFDLKRFPAFFASFGFLCVFHMDIIQQIAHITKSRPPIAPSSCSDTRTARMSSRCCLSRKQ